MEPQRAAACHTGKQAAWYAELLCVVMCMPRRSNPRCLSCPASAGCWLPSMCTASSFYITGGEGGAARAVAGRMQAGMACLDRWLQPAWLERCNEMSQGRRGILLQVGRNCLLLSSVFSRALPRTPAWRRRSSRCSHTTQTRLRIGMERQAEGDQASGMPVVPARPCDALCVTQPGPAFCHTPVHAHRVPASRRMLPAQRAPRGGWAAAAAPQTALQRCRRPTSQHLHGRAVEGRESG